MSESQDYLQLNLPELQEEHAIMAERYKQQIYELKRSLETSNATQAYLAAELENLTKTPPRKQNQSDRMEKELENIRRQNNELKSEYATLQLEYENVSEERTKLRQQLRAAENQLTVQTEKEVNSSLSHNEQRIEALEQENLDLVQKLGQLQEKDMHNGRTLHNMHMNIEMLQDQVHCLEENLQSKREALDENTLLLESTQEQLAEANGKLAVLNSAPDDVVRKGNSLFAEVDDQRQAMKQLLAAQKKSYLEMKKIYETSEHEIRRLKRENAAMHTELQACLSIFCNADKMYQEKLNERIRNLTNQNEDLEKKLKWTQERLRDVADTKGVMWLESMFNFCKQETEDLKQQIHSSCIQKASLEEQLRNAQQEMARWRFESLKLRCILLDREQILNEHKITFKPLNAVTFRITENQLLTAQPNIGHLSTNSDNVTSIEASMAVIKQTPPQKPLNFSHTEKSFGEANVLVECEDNKENRPKNTESKQMDLSNENSMECKKALDTVCLPGPSILCKYRGILASEPPMKNVKFSNKDITIPAAKRDSLQASPQEKNSIIVQKKLSTKSNVIVRRIIVGSKP